MPTLELPKLAPAVGEKSKTHGHAASKRKTRNRTIWQLVRFGLVGCANTTIDLLALNCLLWLWPTQGTARLLLFNTIACNNLLLWLMSQVLLPVHLNPTLWTNSSKVVATGGTILASYLGMRLWVFVQSSHEKRERLVRPRTWQHEELPDKTASGHALRVKHTDKKKGRGTCNRFSLTICSILVSCWRAFSSGE